MTKAAALNRFWSSFGLPAYDEASVPTGQNAPDLPYITYQVVTDSFGGGPVAMNGSIWYKNTSWTTINAKTEQISAKIGLGGMLLHYDGGAVWIRRGTPFAQSMGDPENDQIKRKYINISAKFISSN